jgi:hypothetical protein
MLGRFDGSTLRPIRYREFSQTWGCYPITGGQVRDDRGEVDEEQIRELEQ